MSAAQLHLLHLRADGVSLVVDCSVDRLPRLIHWGADLGEVSRAEVSALAATGVPHRVRVDARDDLAGIALGYELKAADVGPAAQPRNPDRHAGRRLLGRHPRRHAPVP